MAYLTDLSFRRAVAMLLAVLAILAGGTWLTVKVTTEHLVDTDASSNARDWAQFIAANVTDLEQIANGEQPSADQPRLFRGDAPGRTGLPLPDFQPRGLLAARVGPRPHRARRSFRI